MKPIIIGTAGHIDHGKTSLLQQLTGTNTDRLDEEKARGMTIDIGFAFLNDNIAFIDVPGHEKFIKNMVTGVSTIDMAMLIIAADDGIMPQTREHFDILKLLGVKSGILIISKIDLVDEEWLELVLEEIRELISGSFLEDCKIFKISSKTGKGIDELKNFLSSFQITENPELYPLFRMPVDRVFSIKGYGTVVTGSIISGEIKKNDEVEILPAGSKVKIRNIQTHNSDTNMSISGSRTALNLPNIDKKQIQRGAYICTPGYFKTSQLLTCEISLLNTAPALKYNSRLRVHIGTGEFFGRVRLIGCDEIKPGCREIAQIIFEDKISAAFKDKFIIRQYSPMITIGGGTVLDPTPNPIRKKQNKIAHTLSRLSALKTPDWIEYYINQNLQSTTSLNFLSEKLSIHESAILNYLQNLISTKRIIQANNEFFPLQEYKKLTNIARISLENFHKNKPLSPGIEVLNFQKILKISTPLTNFLVTNLCNENEIKIQNNFISLLAFHPELNKEESQIFSQIENLSFEAGFNLISISEIIEKLQVDEQLIKQIIILAKFQNSITILNDGWLFNNKIIQQGKKLIRDYLTKHEQAKVSDLKNVLQISRKYAVPILNYYDQSGLTFRKGDYRYLVE